ncbi:coenzyme F420-0:L-glutamate ligase [Patescibacteria group bacterium]|nr:coenzyme F420-0:L-glutamate ligase [Patescibacteria group bacterium]
MLVNALRPNKGKELVVEFLGKRYARFPVYTHVVNKQDNIVDICQKYLRPHLQVGDFIFISEKIIAITQGRAYSIDEIKPSWLANLLVKFVYKSPYGIGLGSPWTMELAIREAGPLRILVVAFISALTKPLGIRGLFYLVAGHNINSIDGACDTNVPPYNCHVILGPLDANKVAKKIKKELGHDVVIIDANDLGVKVLGKSSVKIQDKFCYTVFKDNPMGQSREQTPLCIVREVG